MTRDEALNWFLEVAKPNIEDNRGMFSTYYYVHEDDYDPYSFYIGYDAYACYVNTENGCKDCSFRTSHGDCGEYHLYINEDGTIYYEGSDKAYKENEFEQFLNEFD